MNREQQQFKGQSRRKLSKNDSSFEDESGESEMVRTEERARNKTTYVCAANECVC